MVHILYGEDKNNIAYELHKLSKYHSPTKLQYLYFDDNHQQILDTVCQIDLFNDEQVFIIYDAFFLMSDKCEDLELTSKLMQLKQELYLVLNTKRNNWNKHAALANIKKISKFSTSNKHTLIVNLLKSQDVTFENDKLLDEFENLVSLDPFMIENELNKLILATDHKIITKSILEKAISSSTELNIFKLTTYLLLRNKELLINLYDNLITLKYQPVELIQIMASQLFNLKLLKQATLEHYSQTDIENGLKITKFMQFANRDILSKVTINQLDQVINELTLLDYNVKHNLANPYLGLKLILSK